MQDDISFLSRGRSGQLGQRSVAGIATVAVHLVALLFLFSSHIDVEPERTVSIAAFDVSAGGADHAEARPRNVEPDPVVPTPVILPPPPIEIPTLNLMRVALMDVPATPDGGGGIGIGAGGGCSLTAQIQEHLRGDDIVMAHVAALEQDSMSVANVLPIWKAGWEPASERISEAALADLRVAVRRVLDASPAACRLQQQKGPRFVYLPAASQTAVLAFGSGQWTWQDVADGDAVPAALPQPTIADAGRKRIQLPDFGATPDATSRVASLRLRWFGE